MPVAEAKAKGLIKVIGREVDEAFLAEVHASCLSPETSRQQGKNLKIVYTPLHGTGITLVPEALKRRGFEKVIVVPEQGKPDGEFPTVDYPNPEEGAALTLGMRIGQEGRRRSGHRYRPGRRPRGYRRARRGRPL